MIDFESDQTTDYLFDEQPTTEYRPPEVPVYATLEDFAAALDEWCRGDMDTWAESPKARRQ